MHLYIYFYLYHYHEGACRRRDLFAAIVDPEGSQCTQRSNTLSLEEKTPGLIVLIIMPVTYTSSISDLLHYK
jgi:hypothetical protein